MTTNRLCKHCGSNKHSSFQCFQAPRKALKAKRPMKKIGHQTEIYIVWRNTVAAPYLDKKYGHVCGKRGCTETEGLELDHKLNRSTHPALKMNVHNVQWLCHTHHLEKTYRTKEKS